jgi:hypothetical protein
MTSSFHDYLKPALGQHSVCKMPQDQTTAAKALLSRPTASEKLRQVLEKHLSDEHLAITDPEEIMQAVAVFCSATQGTRGAGMPLPQQNALELLAMPTVVDSPAPYIDSNLTS